MNQSFIKYIRLTKTQSNLQASVKNLRLVDILIQLPCNKISIVFWWKGEVVRSHSQVILVNFWRRQMLFQYMPTITFTDLNKRGLSLIYHFRCRQKLRGTKLWTSITLFANISSS